MDGGRGVLETVRVAVPAAWNALLDLPCLAGGHSVSGRITTQANSPKLLGEATGNVTFPLYPSGKPCTARGNHLAELSLPALFISGPRDRLAGSKLWPDILASPGACASLQLLDGADHGFHLLKRSCRSHVEILSETAAATGDWTAMLYSSYNIPPATATTRVPAYPGMKQ